MERVQKAPDIIQLQYKITDCEKKSEVVSTSLFSFYWGLEDVQLAELCDKRMDVLPEHVTLDVSHAGTSRSDVLAMARALGPRLAHVHLTDSRGSFKDEHLVPGDGDQPVDQFLRHLRGTRYGGSVVVEINTRGRKAKKRAKTCASAASPSRPRHMPGQGFLTTR